MEGSKATHHLTATTNERKHLAKTDLVTLWAKCGEVPHRSPMIKALEPTQLVAEDAAQVFEWGQKIVTLLSHHWITLLDKQKVMVVEMPESPIGNIVVHTFEMSEFDRNLKIRTTYGNPPKPRSA